jgi:hypothetical protein
MTSTISTTATTRTVADAAAEPVRLHADHNAIKRLGNWTSAERFEDVKRARREGAWPTVDDPTRDPKNA